jgi:hypothetical protein
MRSIPIFNDYLGRQYCSEYCRDKMEDGEEMDAGSIPAFGTIYEQ